VADRAEFERIAEHFFHVTARFGFVEVPNLAAALACARDQGCPLDLDDAIYVAARDEVVRSRTRPRLSAWRRVLFAFMYRNAVRTRTASTCRRIGSSKSAGRSRFRNPPRYCLSRNARMAAIVAAGCSSISQCPNWE